MRQAGGIRRVLSDIRLRESFGVSILTYPAGDHAMAEQALGELADLVVTARRL
jgi:hypothetical protein